MSHQARQSAFRRHVCELAMKAVTAGTFQEGDMTRIIRVGTITLLFSALGCTKAPTGPPTTDSQTVPVQVTLQPTEAVLKPGAGMQLYVVISGVENTPLGFAAVNMQWESSDESIVTVSSWGFIQARRMGTATVSATVMAPCGTHVAELGVRVVPAGATDSSMGPAR
jgi:hypothetical protein